METDKLVFQACMKAAGKIDKDKMKLAIITSSGDLRHIWATRPLVEALDPEKGKIIHDFMEVPFDDKGTLCLPE